MNKDEIRKKLLEELTALQKAYNIPQIEIDKAVLQFEDLIPLLEDKSDLLEQLANDLIDNITQRANIGIPDTIPDDMIVENIPNQPDYSEIEQDELEKIFGDEQYNADYDETLGRKGVVGEDYIANYAEDYAKFADGRITDLPDNHIFVFGSNTAGRHGKGAALDARNHFGAIPGQGYGLQGNSFGIPTKDGDLNVLDNAQIKKYVDRFLEFAKNNPDKTFVVTAIGTGEAGKNPDEIASMFGDVPKNVILSEKFIGKDKIIDFTNTEFPLKKIISGMQKNVDQYGIEAAKILGLDYGGTVNQGFKVVPEGSNSPNFQEFVDSGKWEEIESQDYRDRTKLNAQNADGTVWFGEGDSRGYGATKNYSGDKPWIENPTDVELRQWIIDNNIQTLNVAGNRSYGTEELGQKAMNTIIKAVNPNKLPPQGGSLGAAKLNDPNIFPEKLDELYDENVHTDFKRNILDELDYQSKKILTMINNHPVIKDAGLNGESILLGFYKYFGPKFVEKYNNIQNINLGTKAALGITKGLAKTGLKLGFLGLNLFRLLDPIGEGIELASKIAVKTGAAKTAGLVGKYGTKAGSNILYELKNQAVWQASAAVVAGVQNGAMALNSVLDKYGLFPQALKDAGVEIVPYQDVMQEAANNYRYWQSKYWQASKTTSLMYMLDTAIPSVFTGQSIPTRAQKGLYGVFLPPVFNEKEGIKIPFTENLNIPDLKLSPEDREFWNIVQGWDVADARASRDKWYHVLPGFSLNSGWLQNEMEMTGSPFAPSYYSQVENPNLNEYQQDSHVSVYNRLEKLINRYGQDIVPIAKEAIDYYDTTYGNLDE